MLQDFLSSATSVKDMLSNLCTFLVIQESGSSIPCDSVLDVLENSLQIAVGGGDGDVAMLAVRGAATVLEKFGRSVSKCRTAPAVLKSVFKLVAPPAPASRRSSRGKPTESPAKATFAFESSNQHELDEELLRCLGLTSRYPQLVASLPSSEVQIAFCKSASDSAPPMLMKASLSYMSRLLHNSIRQLTAAGLEDCACFVCAVVDGLGATLDFSPDWDDILRAITHIALIFTRTPLQNIEAQRHAVKRAFLQFCSNALTGGKVADPRQDLIVGCVAAVSENRLQESDLGLWLPWAQSLLSQSVSSLLGRKIKNPYASKHNANDVSLDNDHLDSTTWKPEDARVNCLAMACELMAIPTQRQSRFIVAWQDDHEEFHVYPPSVAAAVVEGYFRGDDEYTLASVSRHHKIVFSSLTQHNTGTDMHRMVHLQPIGTVGSKYRIAQTVLQAKRCSGPMVQQLLPLLPTLSKLASAACSASTMPDTIEPLAKILSLTILTHSYGIISSPDLNADDSLMILRGFVSHAVSSDLCDSCDHLIDQDARWGEYLARCGALRPLHNYLKLCMEANTGEKPQKMHRHEEASTGNSETLRVIARVRKTIHRIEHATTPDIAGSSPQSAEKGDCDSKSQCNLDEIISRAATSSLDETMNSLRMRDGASEGELTALMSHNLSDTALQVLQTAIRRSIISTDVVLRAFTSTLTSELQAAYPSKSTKLDSSLASSSASIGICLHKIPKLFCPGNHALRIHHSAVWTCDECKLHRMTGSLSCRSCNYDLCTVCVARKNPNILDVSYSATVGEVLRYLQGERSVPSGGSHRASVLSIVEALTGVRPPERPLPTRRAPEMVPIPSPLLYSNTGGLISAGTTLLQLVGYDSHLKPEVCPIHLRADHETACKCVSFQSPKLLHSKTPTATPRLAPLPVVPGALSADVPSQSAAIRLLDDLDVPLAPSPAVDQMVIDIVELFATEIFLKGVDGMPRVLRELLSSRARSCVSVGVRQDVMRFCAADNRRYALLHMFAEGMRTRGTVRVELHSNGLATKFAVPRGALLISGVDVAFGTFPTLRNKVEFTFVGEEGTGEGPTQEVYTEVSHNLCARRELWHQTEFGTILFPSTLTRHDEAFRVLGAAFARSFVDGYTMDISLSPLLWEYVSKFHRSLDAECLIRRIEFVALCLDPLWQRSVTSLRLVDDDEAMKELGIYFDAEGSNEEECRQVTIENREEYINTQLKQKFGLCERNAFSFAEGLSRVVDLAITTMLDPQEADGVFCGHNTGDGQPLFSEDDLRAHVVGAHGYTNESPEVGMLVSIVASLTPQEQSHFIEFITGSPRLPLGGLAGLGRKITVVKKEMECGERTLPSCNTCFLYFKLPPYSKPEVMHERMLMAITEGRRNFSLS